MDKASNGHTEMQGRDNQGNNTVKVLGHEFEHDSECGLNPFSMYYRCKKCEIIVYENFKKELIISTENAGYEDVVVSIKKSGVTCKEMVIKEIIE